MIDKPTQEMTVVVDNVERYTWQISTGLPGYDTPSGIYPARSMNKIWYSKQWDDAPMPHAIFFTPQGHAIHGTDDTKKLGRPASHGCVRLAPEHARTLFALVKEQGLENTKIMLNGEAPSSEVQVASPVPPRPEKKPPHEVVQPMEEMPSSEARVAQIKRPKETAESVLNEKTLGNEVEVSSSTPPKPQEQITEIVLSGDAPSSGPKAEFPAQQTTPPKNTSEIALTPKPQMKPPKESASAVEVFDANSAESPLKKSNNDALHSKIGTAATKSAAVKERLAQTEKSSRRGAMPHESASKSSNRPLLLGTPPRSSPAKASPRLTNAAYARNVRRALDRNKPRSVGASGSVTVSFAIGDNGALRSARVARSSGKARLDHAALAIIHRAAPFSPPPGTRQSYTITIDFR